MKFIGAMAWREARASLRRSLLLTASISIGVGVLVAIDSFGSNLREAVHEEARALLGADLALRTSTPFSTDAQQELETLAREERAEVSKVTRFAAMAYVPRTTGTRLVQVSALEGAYPFYGRVETDPPDLWPRLPSGNFVLVDPSLLVTFGARLGDTLALGTGRFEIRGTLVNFPGDIGVRAAFGPRVFIPARLLPDTGLLGFGARAQYEAFLRFVEDPERVAERYRSLFAKERVVLRTVDENEQNLSRSLANMSRFFGLIALSAVLLGGLGVGSAFHVFITRRTDTIAILRCLGAPAGSLLVVYLAQALILSLVGTVIGTLGGLALLLALPRVFSGLLPVAVRPHPVVGASISGLLVGLFVSTLFTLVPLLRIRNVSPLFVLRRPFEGTRQRPPVFAVLALLCGVVVLSAVEVHSVPRGLIFSAGIGATLGVLGLGALGLIRLLKRTFPSSVPYVLRQGLANLHRPTNQTLMVVIVLGFGAFLLDTLLVAQVNLLRDLRVDKRGNRPNLALFDIQKDQSGGVAESLKEFGLAPKPPVPIVPMRIFSIKGTPAASILETSSKEHRQSGMGVLRREYRSTYRDELTPGERSVGGRFWEAGLHPSPSDVVPISLERDLARELGVALGDEIVWDVQGLLVRSRVQHFRELRWARFEPNFYVVFPKGPLEEAPQTFVTLVRAEDPVLRVQLQRKIVTAYPNVSILDLSQVQATIDAIISRAAAVVRFMALFTLVTGGVVLVGATLTSRYQRLREAVLLKTLGATRMQILRIALVEYSVLGGLSVALALGLSGFAGFGLVRFLFDTRFVFPLFPLLGLGGLLLLLVVTVGVATSLGFVLRPPLEALRSE